jgi:hypothetical protein
MILVHLSIKKHISYGREIKYNNFVFYSFYIDIPFWAQQRTNRIFRATTLAILIGYVFEGAAKLLQLSVPLVPKISHELIDRENIHENHRI